MKVMLNRYRDVVGKKFVFDWSGGRRAPWKNTSVMAGLCIVTSINGNRIRYKYCGYGTPLASFRAYGFSLDQYIDTVRWLDYEEAIKNKLEAEQAKDKEARSINAR